MSTAAPVQLHDQRRTLDRAQRFDPRSRSYGVAQVVPDAKVPRSYTWACALVLDQGEEGACVGHAFAHDAVARPVVRGVRSADAFALYRRAQALDGFDDATEGTSVLAGAQAYVEGGYATGYRWAFSLEELILGLGYAGPAILGLWWWTSMATPAADGWVTVSGEREGGHAILARQLHLAWVSGTTPAQKRADGWLEHVDLDASWVLLHNSWSGQWGLSGTCIISLRNLWFGLLKDEGEACFPTGRQ